MVYVLQPMIQHYPDMTGEDPVARKAAFNQWKEEADKMILLFSNVLPDGQKQKNLTSGNYCGLIYLFIYFICWMNT